MYINSSFPPDKFYTPAQRRQQWLDEAADAYRKGFHIMAATCREIAASIA